MLGRFRRFVGHSYRLLIIATDMISIITVGNRGFNSRWLLLVIMLLAII